jgi:Flp pilus assembly protein TadG
MADGAPTPESPLASHPVRESHRPASHPTGVLSRLRHNERGTAVVEFALVSIPLFLLVLGIVDFGRALDYYNNLTQLAGQGARAAVVDRNPDGSGPPSATSIQNQLATKYTTSPELRSPSNHIIVCITAAPSKVGDPVTIKASYTFHFIPFIGNAAGALTINLTASSTERAEVTPVDSNGNLTLGYTANVDQNGQPCS